MKFNKIAIIFDKIDFTTNISYLIWVNKMISLHNNIKVFSLTPCEAELPYMNEIKSSNNRVQKITRLIKNTIKYPAFLIKYINTHRDFSLKCHINNWERYASLLSYDYNIIHFIRPYIYIKLSNIIPKEKIKVTSFVGYDILVLPYVDEIWKNNLKIIFSNFNYLHCVSKYLKNESIKLGADKDKLFVIYQGIDSEYFKKNKSNVNNSTINILTIARLTWQKGLTTAVKAVKNLLNNGYKVNYYIVGDGPEKEPINFWIRRLNLEESVKVLGWKSRSELKEIYTNTHIYLQPSLTEGLSRTCIEASAMEIPIVASNIGGIPEIVQHERNGFLVPPDDPLSFAESLAKLIENQDLRTNMGQEGRKIVLEKFTIEKEINDWLLFYNSCA